MGATEGLVTTEAGIRLYFQKVGDGARTVLFPNGIVEADDFAYLADGRTLIFYDVRNRGRSDTVSDPAQLERGILHDVEDIEAVRRHFGLDRVDLIGHSYMGLTVILYALTYAAQVNRVLQLSPMEPYPGKAYPAELTGVDDTLRAFFARMAELQNEWMSLDPEAFCRKFWTALSVIYVVNPEDAGKIDKWSRCHLANERNFLTQWTQHILPSVQRLNLAPEMLSQVTAPVLIVHGTKDRSAAYGGARDWAMALPNARLITVKDACHAPWVEAPEQVFAQIRTFLDGAWPESAQKVDSLLA